MKGLVVKLTVIIILILSISFFFFFRQAFSCLNPIDSLRYYEFSQFFYAFAGIALSLLTIILIYLTYEEQVSQNKALKDTSYLQHLDTEFSQMIDDINDIRYKGFTGIDALYNWDSEHGKNPNSVFNSLNYILFRFSGHIKKITETIHVIETKDFLFSRAYLMFHSKIIWPVLQKIYDDPAFTGHTDTIKERLKLLIGDTYAFFDGRNELQPPHDEKILNILRERQDRKNKK